MEHKVDGPKVQIVATVQWDIEGLFLGQSVENFPNIAEAKKGADAWFKAMMTQEGAMDLTPDLSPILTAASSAQTRDVYSMHKRVGLQDGRLFTCYARFIDENGYAKQRPLFV